MNEKQTLKVMILDFAYWLEANKHINNDADSLVNQYLSFIDKQLAGIVPDVLPCQYCKTTEYVVHRTHGLNDQCWKCGAYVRKPYLSERL